MNTPQGEFAPTPEQTLLSTVQVKILEPGQNADELQAIAEKAFGGNTDAELSEWFSFAEMTRMVQEGAGICVGATSDKDELIGWMYAQQESPINGPEGAEKWVIIMAAIDPQSSGSGVGSKLLKELEHGAHDRGARKMFVFTNDGDDRVINFYHKCGYKNAGRIDDYQYGENNSAVFLLKYLSAV